MTATAFAPAGALAAGRRRHDQSLMESVYATHARPLLRFLLGLTRNERPAAEDLLQETMVRVWRHIDDVPSEEENTRRWLFTIARRVAIDAARMRQSRPTEVNLTEADNMSAMDTVEAGLAAREMIAAIHRLSDEHRAVLSELHLRGSSIEEAAEHLGIPAGTVKSRAHYALRFLRETLNPVDQ